MTLTSSLFFRCLNNLASQLGPGTIHFFDNGDGTISDDGTGAVAFHRL